MNAQAITQAFQQAAQELNKPYILKGRGHEARCCLETWVSRLAAPVLEEGKHFEIVCVGYKTTGPRRVFASELVERAAQILGVEVTALVTANYR